MLSAMRSSKRSFFGWVIIGLLIIGLGAFGFTDILTGGSSQSVARVGKTDVTVTEFRVAFENRINALQRQFGIRIDAATAQNQGIDDAVVAELLRSAAYRDEAARVGLSTPDEAVQEAVLSTPGLANAAGEFDAATYRYFLQQRGLNPARYETLVRQSETVATLQNVVAAGATLPPVAANTLMTFLGEERSIAWALIASDPEAVEDPGDETLQTFLEENEPRYRTPEYRQITFARLIPEELAETIEVSDEELREIYEAEIDRFRQPARRIVERLSFPDEAAAEAARTAIEAGETNLVELAAERGLTSGDISLGLVAERDLDRAAREPVFATDETGIVGPIATDLGPVLYAINAILPASEVSFEDARDDLAREVALQEAGDLAIDENIRAEELIAGGATPQELADETAYTLGTARVARGEAGDVPPEVVAEAFASDLGEDRDQIEVGELNFYAVRVDEIIPPELPPLAEIRADVLADWRDAEALAATMEQAEMLRAELEEGRTLTAIAERDGLIVQEDSEITRDGELGLLPPDLLPQLFEAEPGTPLVVETEAGAALVVLTDITPFDLEGEEAATLREIFTTQTSIDVEQDVAAYFANSIADERGVRINQTVLDQIVQSLR
ncbi:SurA N-terminal domain-containing protein [Pontivivens ytuae]|uniref:SurA N-terminal domain-containing protein n=2 Tax=Pontivivens ytuae TaxID=2789856 RepID=A0A7S9LRK5_9RHOB|nr:SurA N-terminal domain-containing protein [Pontivivens ytuae]